MSLKSYRCRLVPQALEDAEEPTPSRLATLRDPGTSDQIMLDQHSLTHFPSQLWCKVCVESRGRDSHREPSKIDAVVSELQFDYGYIEDGGPLLIACFFVGTDTSSGAIHATMVPDSKKMPHAVAGTAKWVLRHMDDVVGTGPEEHLMSDFQTHEDQSVF